MFHSLSNEYFTPRTTGYEPEGEGVEPLSQPFLRKIRSIAKRTELPNQFQYKLFK